MIIRSHVYRHHPQPQLSARPSPARILSVRRQDQESYPRQPLALARRAPRGRAATVARRVRPGRRSFARSASGTGLWPALRGQAGGGNAGDQRGAGSPSAGEAGVVPGAGAGRSPRLAAIGGVMGGRSGGGGNAGPGEVRRGRSVCRPGRSGGPPRADGEGALPGLLASARPAAPAVSLRCHE